MTRPGDPEGFTTVTRRAVVLDRGGVGPDGRALVSVRPLARDGHLLVVVVTPDGRRLVARLALQHR